MSSKSPRLNEVFLVREAPTWQVPDKAKLKPAQNAVVEKFAKQLLDYIGPPGSPVKTDLQARVRDILRQVVIASEMAEDDGDVKDVEQ